MDREDTSDGRGGGILTYVSNKIQAVEETIEKASSFNQASAISIMTNDGQYRIVTVYRSPNSSRENNDALNELVKSLSVGRTILVGDFNFRHIDWNKGCLTAPDKAAENFYDTVCDGFLNQYVDFPTRNEYALDLVLGTQTASISNINEEGKLGSSDHVAISFRFGEKIKTVSKSKEKVPNFSKANFQAIAESLSAYDWEKELGALTIELAWERLRNILHNLVKEYVPLVYRRTYSKPVWANNSALEAIKAKQKTWSHYRKGLCNLEAFKQSEKNTKKIIQKAKRKFERAIAKEAKKNPRKFYAYLNRKSKNTIIGPIKSENNCTILDDKNKSEIFNKCFGAVFVPDDGIDVEPPKIFQGDESETLCDIEITPEIVTKKLRALKTNSAPGPDGIHPRVLKECSSQLGLPFSILFRTSLDSGTLPSEWKQTNVCPVFKKGKKDDPKNFRPINLASVPAKVMEQILKDNIQEHLTTHQLISKSQHGFVPGRSCTSNLLEHMNNVTRALDSGQNFDTILLDFKRAFDKVPFRHMLAKVKSHGIGGRVLKWIEDWTRGRKQRVVLNGEHSRENPSHFGTRLRASLRFE